MLSESIAKLVQYGITTGLTPECERNYTTNLLLDVFHEDDYEKPDNIEESVNLEATLGELLDEAVKRGLIEDSIVYRDLFDTRLMNCLMPRPGQVQKEFWDKYKESPKEATDYFYKLSQDSNYIRRYRVEKDQKWKVDSPYGEIDITINLSKPEKDPKAIAAAAIRNVFFARKMKDMRDVLIIRQGRITGLFRSQSMILLGDSSILRMCITMSIALCLTASILQ